MSTRSFDFDISVSAAKNKASISRKKTHGMFETSKQKCHHKNCTKVAQFRAPVSPDRLNEFRWFCEKHIQQYNNKWDYFEGNSRRMENDEQVNRSDLGIKEKERFTWSKFGLNDSLEILEDQKSGFDSDHRPLKLNNTEQRAADILCLVQYTQSEARKKYRSLVKELHPDNKKGDRTDENRLREVVWAWKQIKSSRKFRD